jgi:hypothetical protein
MAFRLSPQKQTELANLLSQKAKEVLEAASRLQRAAAALPAMSQAQKGSRKD